MQSLITSKLCDSWDINQLSSAWLFRAKTIFNLFMEMLLLLQGRIDCRWFAEAIVLEEWSGNQSSRDSLLSWFHWERLKQQPTRWLCPSSSIVSNFGHDFYVPRLLKLVEAVELFYLSSFFWGSWHPRNFRDVGCHEESLEVAGTELRTSWSWDNSSDYLTTPRTFRPEMGWTLNSQARVKVAVDNLEVELLG